MSTWCDNLLTGGSYTLQEDKTAKNGLAKPLKADTSTSIEELSSLAVHSLYPEPLRRLRIIRIAQELGPPKGQTKKKDKKDNERV